jgi:hypothetical protein
VMGALITLLALWWWRMRRVNDEVLWITGLAAWCWWLDFFLPAYRHPYNDVAALLVMLCALRARPVAFWLAAAAIPAGIVLYNVVPGARWQIHIPTVLAGAAALVLCVPWRRRAA